MTTGTASFTQNSTFPTILGVLPDNIVIPEKGSKRKAMATVYVQGACNVRCSDVDPHPFSAGDLVIAAMENEVLVAVTQSYAEKISTDVVGILGTCLDGKSTGAATYVRTYVDNHFNTVLACCKNH